MSTEWKSQQGDGKYSLQFETDDREKYLLVEKAAQSVMDVKKSESKTPMIHGKDGTTREIIRYHRYNDDCVDFESNRYKYRMTYIMEIGKNFYPHGKIHRFETYDDVFKDWKETTWISGIELIEGVDEYDKT